MSAFASLLARAPHVPLFRRIALTAIACTAAVACCLTAVITASALDRDGTATAASLRDNACIGDAAALASTPDGRSLFVFSKDGTICRVHAEDLSVAGVAHVDDGFATATPHVEFTPDGGTMLVNGTKGVVAVDVSDLGTTLFPSSADDYMLSPDGTHISVIESAGQTSGDAVSSRSWTLRTFSAIDGGDSVTVPLRFPGSFDTARVRDIMPYTMNSTGTVWFVGVDDGDDGSVGTSTEQSLRLMAVDVATGAMTDIADDASATIYAVGAYSAGADKQRVLYMGTADARVLAIDVDAYESGSDGATVVRTVFERHLPLDRILLASNGARMLVGMTNGKLVVDADTMQWLDAGGLVSSINPDGTLLYSLDRRGSSDTSRAGDSSGTTDGADDAVVLRVNTFDEDDPAVTRALRFAGSGAIYDHAAGWTYSPDGGTWYVLLAAAAGGGNAVAGQQHGADRPGVLLAVDVSPFTAESVSRADTSAERQAPPLSTTAMAVVIAVAALLVVLIAVMRRRTSW